MVEAYAAYALIGLAITDLVAMLFMPNRYWQFGIPGFRHTIKLGKPCNSLPPSYELNDKFKTGLVSGFHFKAFSNTEYGFRESFRLTLVSYSPLMRGIVKLDPVFGYVTVTGIFYWWVFGFLGFVAYRLAETPSDNPHTMEFLTVFATFGTTLMAGLYLIQWSRFRKVAKHVTNELSSNQGF